MIQLILIVMTTLTDSERYTRYCRPELGKLLRAIQVDKVYHRGEGDLLYYTNEVGQEVAILDFLGGYGASLFGHAYSPLVQRLQQCLTEQIPFHTQGSCRHQVALLAEKLSQMMESRTGQPQVCTFGSTGAEIVEVALKHALMARRQQIQSQQKSWQRHMVKIETQWQSGTLKWATETAQNWCAATGQSSLPDWPRLKEQLNQQQQQYWQVQPRFVALERSFHGKTSAAVQMTWANLYREPFVSFGLSVDFVPPDQDSDLSACFEQHHQWIWDWQQNEHKEWILMAIPATAIAALLVEPLQGEGGIHPLTARFLVHARQLTQHYQIPLIVDEIQSGMGRTGTFLYSEQTGVIGDYVLLSKSLGGGLTKIAVLMIPQPLYCNEFSVIHSSTFAEDEYSAAVALAALDVLESANIPGRCRVQGAALKSQLEELQGYYPQVIRDVRGAGLMLGIELHSQANASHWGMQMLAQQELLGFAVAGYLLNEHQIRVAPTLSSHLTIRLEPSAWISDAACRQLIIALSRLCDILSKGHVWALTRHMATRQPAPPIWPELPAAPPSPIVPTALPRVAFIGHFIQATHMGLWDPSFKSASAKELENYLDRIWSLVNPQVYDRKVVTSHTGQQVELLFLGWCIDSRIISHYLRAGQSLPLQEQIHATVDLAVAEGCQAIGLGGYSSILMANGRAIVRDDIAVTSGNALTVAMGLESIHQAAAEQGIDVSKACFAAIGATGNIASLYSQLMAEEAARIILISRPGREEALIPLAASIYTQALQSIHQYPEDQLKGIAHHICHTQAVAQALPQIANPQIGLWLAQQLVKEMIVPPVAITSDLLRLQQAQLILGASNSPVPVIEPGMLHPGAVVICDISVPLDTAPTVARERPDVLVIQGGVVKLPQDDDFTIAGIPLEPGLAFACMGETLLMGLEDIRQHYSYGPLLPEKVKHITQIAQKHGFGLGRSKIESSY